MKQITKVTDIYKNIDCSGQVIPVMQRSRRSLIVREGQVQAG